MEICSGLSPDWYWRGSFTLWIFRRWLVICLIVESLLECKTDPLDHGNEGGSERPKEFSLLQLRGLGNELKVWREKAGLKALLCHWLSPITSVIVLGPGFFTLKLGRTTPSQANHLRAIHWNGTVRKLHYNSQSLHAMPTLQSGGATLAEQMCWSSYPTPIYFEWGWEPSFGSFKTHLDELPQASHIISSELPVSGGVWAANCSLGESFKGILETLVSSIW